MSFDERFLCRNTEESKGEQAKARQSDCLIIPIHPILGRIAKKIIFATFICVVEFY
jgi:hypothetical protein